MSGSIKINDYDLFNCIADQCPFTCCQEWRIGVDNHTYLKWEGKKLKGSEKTDLCHQVQRKPSGNYIKLDEHKKCPFLDQRGLCKVVKEFGADYLSNTCTVFPRQINEFQDRTEYALDFGCPEVVDMMWKNKGNITFAVQNTEKTEKDLLFTVRDMMLWLIQDETYPVTFRLMLIFYSLLELDEAGEKLSRSMVQKCKEKAWLNPVAEAIEKMTFHPMDTLYECNELFLDVVENYRRQKLYTRYLEEIAVFAEHLEENYDETELIKAYNEFTDLFKSYEKLMVHYMTSEIFASGLTEGMDLQDMLIVYEWITMEYAVTRQAIFLKWLMQGKSDKLAYETVKCYLMVISRVTGYDQEDIREYLENSFEEIIWEWGYLALITGNNKM